MVTLTHDVEKRLDELIQNLYGSITSTDDQKPDFEMLRSLFVENGIVVNNSLGNTKQMKVDEFIRGFEENLQKGAIKSFEEKELCRTVEHFGTIMQVFSTYEGKKNAGEERTFRGINSIQLIYLEEHWKIVSMVWDMETPGNPLPEKYIRK